MTTVRFVAPTTSTPPSPFQFPFSIEGFWSISFYNSFVVFDRTPLPPHLRRRLAATPYLSPERRRDHLTYPLGQVVPPPASQPFGHSGCRAMGSGWLFSRNLDVRTKSGGVGMSPSRLESTAPSPPSCARPKLGRRVPFTCTLWGAVSPDFRFTSPSLLLKQVACLPDCGCVN